MSDLHYPTASPAMAKDIMAENLVLTLEDYNDSFGVIVGTGKERRILSFPAKVLGLDSQFFRLKTMFYSFSPYADHQNHTIDLAKQNLDAMNAFFAWNTTRNIYSAKRLCKPKALSYEKVTTERLDEYRALWDQLLECYFLSDFLGAPKFGNAIIDALFEAIENERKERDELKLQPEEKVFVHLLAPTLRVDDNENEIEFDVDDDDEDEDDDDEDEDDDGSWRDYRDPFEENVPQAEIRQILGTLPYQIQRVYLMTKPRSALRKMLLDNIVLQAMTYGHYKKLHTVIKEGVPIEFHRDLVDELMRTAIMAADHDMNSGVRADLRALKRCLYHIHKVGERCP